MLFSIITSLWLTTMGLAGCQSQSQQITAGYKSVFPYTLKADESHSMPKELKEISGITFVEGQSNILYAIQDEEGVLFSYDLRKKQVIATNAFAKKGDYEEITTDNHYFYVLKSNGDIYSFPIGSSSYATEVIINKSLVPTAEYESMAFDPSSGNLFLLCKVCKVDKKGQHVSGYILQIGNQGKLTYKGNFNLSIDALTALDQRIKKTFKPSAMARHTASNEWYILSSIDQSLVITDDTFRPKEIVRLPRKDFEQPEGLAFDAEGNLYISSEAGTQKHGMVYKYNRIR
ncbi:SdiA-regulated [Sphingobacterium wenxiniae]|uniref:SdiA-regulated n=2 Tax=Sphingobacterium wenxiniae TaxID=683125 RepID=A0A1I6S7Y7_9SPHI|nr:SdiA-regulated [Sphingobacterium wenxiniae]